MNKIFYRFIEGQHKFYGLVGMPEKPPLYFTHYRAGDQVAETGQRASQIYNEEIERIKSTALEIINPEELNLIKDNDTYWISIINRTYLKDNDIFDLPQGMEFKKCFRSPIGTIHEFQLDSETPVLRIVKAETEEHDCTDYAKINCSCPKGYCKLNQYYDVMTGEPSVKAEKEQEESQEDLLHILLL